MDVLTPPQREALGLYLSSLLRAQGHTQHHIAGQLHLSEAAISRLVRGRAIKSSTYARAFSELFSLKLPDALRAAANLHHMTHRHGGPVMATALSPEPYARSGAFAPRALILTIASQKGGVGKTTLAVNLAYEMTQRGHRVLLADLDPQGDATMALGLATDGEGWFDAARALKRERPEPWSALTIHESPHGFDLIPSGAETEDLGTAADGFTQRNHVVRRVLDGLKDAYDLILVDSPPTLGTLQRNALAAADYILFPAQVHKAAINGLDRIINTIDELRASDPTIAILGAVPFMTRNTVLTREIKRELRERHWARVTDTDIPASTKFGESYYATEPLSIYDASSKPARAMRTLARELEGRLLQEV